MKTSVSCRTSTRTYLMISSGLIDSISYTSIGETILPAYGQPLTNSCCCTQAYYRCGTHGYTPPSSALTTLTSRLPGIRHHHTYFYSHEGRRVAVSEVIPQSDSLRDILVTHRAYMSTLLRPRLKRVHTRCCNHTTNPNKSGRPQFEAEHSMRQTSKRGNMTAVPLPHTDTSMMTPA